MPFVDPIHFSRLTTSSRNWDYQSCQLCHKRMQIQHKRPNFVLCHNGSGVHCLGKSGHIVTHMQLCTFDSTSCRLYMHYTTGYQGVNLRISTTPPSLYSLVKITYPTPHQATPSYSSQTHSSQAVHSVLDTPSLTLH